MQKDAEQVMEALNAAFPQRLPQGSVAPHDCEECASIRLGLAELTWGEVPNEFAEEFYDALPLLSPDAYNAYLPVWLRAAMANPDGNVGSFVGINLSSEPSKAGFNAAQASVLVAVVEYVASKNLWGAEDASNVETVAAVKAKWASHFA
jgi:hypothetical protein